jgi:poly(3-hydroxybutyrate) depolymerase
MRLMRAGLRRSGRARRSLVVAGAVAVLVGAAWPAAVLVIRASGSDADSGTAVRVRLDGYGRLRAFDVYYRDLVRDHHTLVRRRSFTYTAWNGEARTAYVLLPAWYTARRNPPLPLVISPHGRGLEARDNLHFWGGLPAFGPFMVISPEGQGRALTRYSWGWKGQIDDLARMPALLAQKLPWVRIDRRRIDAVGSSMGGQETLLLVARYPRLLAGAAALDSDTDMAARYRAFSRLPGGLRLQGFARQEMGGTPADVASAYRLRSPVDWAEAIARSGVPLHIWWSTRDRIVTNQRDESGRLYRLLRAMQPRAPVTQYVGSWAHSKEFHASARLPLALVRLDLIRLSETIPAPDRVSRTPPTR